MTEASYEMSLKKRTDDLLRILTVGDSFEMQPQHVKTQRTYASFFGAATDRKFSIKKLNNKFYCYRLS